MIPVRFNFVDVYMIILVYTCTRVKARIPTLLSPLAVHRCLQIPSNSVHRRTCVADLKVLVC